MARKITPKKRKFLREKPVKRNCEFCNQKFEPDYKNYKDIKKYLTDRTRILGKDRTGICSKHQRKLTVAIKRARHLGFLPFAPEM